MSNKATWLKAKGEPFVIDDAPMPEPEADEVIIRTHAVAINPADAAMQNTGIIVTSYPTVTGCDVAGVVTAVGASVTRVRPGDRVLAMLDYTAQRENKGCFQLFCGAQEALTAKLPDTVRFRDGCVLPLALCTAGVSLFQKTNLGLPLPQVNPTPTGRVLLVWGGSSSVGSCGIQLAKAAGYEVATTCSAHNFDYCKGVGADYVFDYQEESVVETVVSALTGRAFAGVFDAVMAADTIVKSAEIAHRLDGNKFVATILIGPPTPMLVPAGLPDDVRAGYCWCNAMKTDELGPPIWGNWLTPALANGALKCKPDPAIVGQGLEAIQEAVDLMAEGVSATKLVVEIP